MSFSHHQSATKSTEWNIAVIQPVLFNATKEERILSDKTHLGIFTGPRLMYGNRHCHFQKNELQSKGYDPLKLIQEYYWDFTDLLNASFSIDELNDLVASYVAGGRTHT